MLGILFALCALGFVECRKGVRNTRMLLRFLRNRDLVNPGQPKPQHNPRKEKRRGIWSWGVSLPGSSKVP